MDIFDEGTSYRLIAEVPGAGKDDVTVQPGPTEGTLELRVQPRTPGTSAEGAVLLRSERGTRNGAVAFARVVPIAWNADVTKAKTRVTSGLVEVTIPKKESEAAGTKSSSTASDKKK